MIKANLLWGIGLTLLISFCLEASADVSLRSSDSVLDQYVGRVTRASIRLPTDSAGRDLVSSNAKDGEAMEDIFTELIDSPMVCVKFSFEQKRELTFVALILGRVEGGSLTTLLILLDREAYKVSQDLGRISDAVLAEELFMTKKEIDKFRKKLSYLGKRNR